MVQHRESKPVIGVDKSSNLSFCGYHLAKFKSLATIIPVELHKLTRLKRKVLHSRLHLHRCQRGTCASVNEQHPG